ncbi:MAG: hypothetical protein M0Q91_13380 [Methanoregula sp.]|jgi:hypothetical protein|nr:hypothetical protein [Methanoregula sp.]
MVKIEYRNTVLKDGRYQNEYRLITEDKTWIISEEAVMWLQLYIKDALAAGEIGLESAERGDCK